MTNNKEKLWEMAQKQAGLFTLAQAKALGISPTNATYYLRKGAWKQAGNDPKARLGIYELTSINADQSLYSFWLAYLWTHDKQGRPKGTISHRAAGYIWDIIDILPADIDLIVSPNFSRRSNPPTAVKLHHMRLDPDDRALHESGIMITTPIATLRYLLRGDVISVDYIEQGFKNAIGRNLISTAEKLTLPGFTVDEKNLVRQWIA